MSSATIVTMLGLLPFAGAVAPRGTSCAGAAVFLPAGPPPIFGAGVFMQPAPLASRAAPRLAATGFRSRCQDDGTTVGGWGMVRRAFREGGWAGFPRSQYDGRGTAPAAPRAGRTDQRPAGSSSTRQPVGLTG